MNIDYSMLQKLIGKESQKILALDSVSKSDVRHWCEVIGDSDPDYHSKIKSGEKPAASQMTMVWAMPPLWTPDPKEITEPFEHAFKILDDAGFNLSIGISLNFISYGPININDRLNYTVTIKDISASETETVLGNGYTVDLLYQFANQKGDLVSEINYTILKLKMLKIHKNNSDK